MVGPRAMTGGHQYRAVPGSLVEFTGVSSWNCAECGDRILSVGAPPARARCWPSGYRGDAGLSCEEAMAWQVQSS